MKTHPVVTALLSICALLLPKPLGAALTNYWPLSETTGTTAPNTVAGATAAELFGTPSWATDATRGQVLQFDGVSGSYANAGELPEFLPDADFTWSFWANSAQGPNNNVIVGNRYPDTGWIKFTTNAFEIRDITPTYNGTLDYANFPTGTWVHHVVVKKGPVFTYYRDGLALNGRVLDVASPLVPLYFGGDQALENWAGLLDDVATWSDALPLSSITGLTTGTVTPATAPLTPAAPPATVEVLSETFSGGLGAWTAINRGLESTAVSTYDPPAIVAGELVLGGPTNAQYWLGSSLQTNQAFDSRLYTQIEVRRVSLSGSGSAYRSSLWVFGDDTHYLHFSQNVGENGWQWNANDATGLGTSLPTGGGNNIPSLDGLDGDTGSHVMTLRVVPLGNTSGRINIQMLVDGEVHATHGFNAFPTTFKVILTGQARAIGDTASAVFDEVHVRRENVANLPPSFSPAASVGPPVIEGAALSFNAAPFASDTENNPLTFSKTSGPAWVTVSNAGLVGGTAPVGSAGFAQVVVRVLDTVGLGTSTFTLSFRVSPPSAPVPAVFGWWPLNEGSGAVANDVSGAGRHGIIQNPDTGGLGDNGIVWFQDPTHGPVISFDGTDSTGAYVIVGDPPGDVTLPIFTLDDSFTWSLWAKSDQGGNNDIILGNRYDANGAAFVPLDFVKFTTTNFEWYFNGGGQFINYADIVSGVWAHHLVVKEGASLFYYRDSVLTDGRSITGAPTAALPLFFGGQGVENWRGYLADVRLYSGSLSDAAVDALFDAGPTGPPPPAAVFRITTVTRAADGALTLSWPSEAGQQFNVQWSTSLASAAWTPVGGTLTATGTTTSFTLPAGGTPNPATIPAGFLRVRRL